MNDIVHLSRSKATTVAHEDTPRNVFSDGLLGLTFITWGKHQTAHSGNLRPRYDAWRLRWWYHVAIVENHWKHIGGKCQYIPHHRLGLLPLSVAKRWSHRRGPFLDLLVFEEESQS